MPYDYVRSLQARVQRKVAKRKKKAPKRWQLKFMRRDVMGDMAFNYDLEGYSFTEIAFALSKTRKYVREAIALRM